MGSEGLNLFVNSARKRVNRQRAESQQFIEQLNAKLTAGVPPKAESPGIKIAMKLNVSKSQVV